MSEKVVKLALASRLIVLSLQLISNKLMPDHHPDVFRVPKPQVDASEASWETVQTPHTHLPPAMATLAMNKPGEEQQRLIMRATIMDKIVHFLLGGLRHWDGEYYLHIAEHTYSYENTLAFYPLFPMLLRYISQALHSIGLGLMRSSCILLVAVTLNVYCFCKAAECLYELTLAISGDAIKSWNAALLFCFNPASIFFTAVYSEALYAWLSFQLMLQCVTSLHLARTTTTLALTLLTRSNGLVNLGFPCYFTLRRIALQPLRASLLLLLKLSCCICCALVPLSFFYFYAFKQFCLPETTELAHAPEVLVYAEQQHYVLAGTRQPQNSPWCDLSLPFPYSYIQSHYWNVGFLRYYQLKQLPNFLLAAPVVLFLLWNCGSFFNQLCQSLQRQSLQQQIKQNKCFPFVVHALVLTLFCLAFVHIQISTRLLCSATPCLYWFAADYFPKTFDQIRLRSKAGVIVFWFSGYFLVGTLMFSNNFPWT